MKVAGAKEMSAVGHKRSLSESHLDWGLLASYPGGYMSGQ